jgi:hypothetical protein
MHNDFSLFGLDGDAVMIGQWQLKENYSAISDIADERERRTFDKPLTSLRLRGRRLARTMLTDEDLKRFETIFAEWARRKWGGAGAVIPQAIVFDDF